jgi:hypothetical protein
MLRRIEAKRAGLRGRRGGWFILTLDGLVEVGMQDFFGVEHAGSPDRIIRENLTGAG